KTLAERIKRRPTFDVLEDRLTPSTVAPTPPWWNQIPGWPGDPCKLPVVSTTSSPGSTTVIYGSGSGSFGGSILTSASISGALTASGTASHSTTILVASVIKGSGTKQETGAGKGSGATSFIASGSQRGSGSVSATHRGSGTTITPLRA